MKRRRSYSYSRLRCSSSRRPTRPASRSATTITSGTAGDNGWYRSAVDRADHRHRERPTRRARQSKTFRAKSSDVLDCTATDGNA